MDEKIMMEGNRHRLSIGRNAVVVEYRNLDNMAKWKTLFCIWKEDIKHFKKAFDILKDKG